MIKKIFPELIGIHKLNYFTVGASPEAGIRPVTVPGEAIAAVPTAETSSGAVNEETFAESFLSAASGRLRKGMTVEELATLVRVRAERNQTQGEIKILQGMTDVADRNRHLFGLKLKDTGDWLRLRQFNTGRAGNLTKVLLVSAVTSFLAYYTVTEGISAVNAIQQLAAGGQDLTQHLQNLNIILNLSALNAGSDEMNQAISSLTQHGTLTVENGLGTIGTVAAGLLVRPLDRVRQTSHFTGRAIHAAGSAIGKAMKTGEVIESAQTPKANLQVVGKKQNE